jgi:hypothetical protein
VAIIGNGNVCNGLWAWQKEEGNAEGLQLVEEN